MKKVLVLAVLFVLIGTSAFAWTCKSSGLLTSSSAIAKQPNLICGIIVLGDGTNAATVTLYNNKEAASGTLLWPPIVIAAGEYYGGAMFPFILSADQGVYISVSGTGAQVFPYYDAQ